MMNSKDAHHCEWANITDSDHCTENFHDLKAARLAIIIEKATRMGIYLVRRSGRTFLLFLVEEPLVN
jgi:hypothetical protein